ncbi:MAG: hypothetical protein PHF44_03945 [Candidatus Pacebacteria bacterium]|nr:hypothetical protein [Candidatus Paceibacterota bacterium]
MLKENQKYLQIAFNRSLEETAQMINSLPLSDRIIIEAGYPLIKTYGTRAISAIKTFWGQRIFGYGAGVPDTPEFNLSQISPLLGLLVGQLKESRKEIKSEKTSFSPYIVADLKCMDRAFAEVEAAKDSGASAATCLGLAPIETINLFIKKCKELGIDSFLDMMNIEYPFEILQNLAEPPKVVMLHRGVDEGEENLEKEIPYHEIEMIKNVYDNVLIAVAGGESAKEAMRGAFNGADIIIVWRQFNENPERISSLASEFLRELK